MSAQPTVLVETCPFTACNAVPDEAVEVSVRSALDDCSLVGNAFCTALAGTRSVRTNALGFAAFTDLVIESSGGVTLPQVPCTLHPHTHTHSYSHSNFHPRPNFNSPSFSSRPAPPPGRTSCTLHPAPCILHPAPSFCGLP